ncbi:VapB-type antitoxin [Acidianus ambivalens]|uniref:VapB-type antitoxin n=1 Tax=Acidianus ambivalens TaxID=2283 RepID=A0A650CUN0_ACIAM|nr:VapB-type antitoxin [Acidianus ambivalens]MQL56030.1 VapB-type antitoxin [Acidianus ambivalens]QGR21415.1 VapB-type antitoxin [Acidianus ambivalens]
MSQLIKLPKDLKEKMTRYNVNWNSIIREFVYEKIEELERQEHARKAIEILKSLNFSYEGAKEVVKNRNSS